MTTFRNLSFVIYAYAILTPGVAASTLPQLAASVSIPGFFAAQSSL